MKSCVFVVVSKSEKNVLCCTFVFLKNVPVCVSDGFSASDIWVSDNKITSPEKH